MNKTSKFSKTLTGRVVSNKMNKTIVVLIEDKVAHPKYKKYLKRSHKEFAHDENNSCVNGDIVLIEETRPLSKKKNWKLVEVLNKSTSQVAE